MIGVYIGKKKKIYFCHVSKHILVEKYFDMFVEYVFFFSNAKSTKKNCLSEQSELIRKQKKENESSKSILIGSEQWINVIIA